jgi:hypothetical protein
VFRAKGGRLPKTLRENLAEKDWGGPSADLIYTIFLLMRDGAEILALMGVAAGVERLLELLNWPAIHIYEKEIHAEQIIKNFDYALLILFLVVQGFRLFKNMVLKK